MLITSRSFKSKKELEKEGRTLGIELDRRHSKEDLIEELEAVKPKKVESTTSDVTWNSIEEFTEAVTSTGMIFDHHMCLLILKLFMGLSHPIQKNSKKPQLTNF